MQGAQAVQTDMFAEIAERRFLARHPGEMTIQERFDLFHHNHPQVYALFSRYVKSHIAAGRRRISSKHLIERIRAEVNIGTDGAFEINNDFTSRYVRKYLELNPHHRGLFRLRELRTE